MGRGPKLPTQGLLTFEFGGVGLPYGATPSLGLVGPAAVYSDSAFQAGVLSAANDLVQLTCTSTVTLNQLILKEGPEAVGPTYVLASGTAGAQGANQAPPQVAMLVRKTVTGVTTRLMGRMFWPGVSEGNVDSAGVLGPSAVTDFQNAFNDFQTALAFFNVEPCVFNETSDERIVDGLDVQVRVATQRDRLRR